MTEMRTPHLLLILSHRQPHHVSIGAFLPCPSSLSSPFLFVSLPPPPPRSPILSPSLVTLLIPTDPSNYIGTKWSTESHRVRVLNFKETPGPIHQLGNDADPLQFFGLFWQPAFFERLADENNLYVQQRQITQPEKRWYPTTAEEMRAFVGVNIIMGIDRKPELSHYWSKRRVPWERRHKEGLPTRAIRASDKVPPPPQFPPDAGKGQPTLRSLVQGPATGRSLPG